MAYARFTRIGAGGIPIVAPGPVAAVGAAGGLFPFGFGRQAQAGPDGVGLGVPVGDADDGLAEAGEAGIVPSRRAGVFSVSSRKRVYWATVTGYRLM